MGGTTEIRPFLPETLVLMLNVPLGVRLMRMLLTGPCSPCGSRYLKPYEPTPSQNARPVLLSPCGRGKSCVVGLAPLAMIVRSAPPALPVAVGLPTMVFGLPASRAVDVILRLDGSDG